MWRYNKLFFTLLFVFQIGLIFSQYNIEGKIVDAETQESMPYVHVCIDDYRACSVSDVNGFFQFSDIKKGIHHLDFGFVGYESLELDINLVQDTFLNISLKGVSTEIAEVEILRAHSKSDISNEISEEEIARNSDKNIGDVLEKLEGVKVLRSGTSVSKPIVDGNYGNRVNVINNGIIQSGQEWGNDHTLEIDAFSATEISSLSNAEAIEYSVNSLGGMIKIDQSNIHVQDAFKTKVNYAFNSNGLGHTLNAQLEKYNKILPFRISATFKRNGDYRTPDYYLTNTGASEISVSSYFEKKFSNRLRTNLFYSFFNSKNGILKGSHVGNLSDLEVAIGKEVPFFTENDFSYQIANPHQSVFHHLLKSETKYIINETQYLSFKYGLQINNRKEFDVKRASQAQTPALSMLKITNDFSLVHFKHFSKKWDLKTGLQFNFTDNTNNPETGILPLIPDYNMLRPSVFAIAKSNFKKLVWETGFRYDFSLYNVAAISKTLPRKIERHQLLYQNVSVSSSVEYQINKRFSLNGNLSFYSRAPEINELFSNGLHQGVSGLEIGDINLKSEYALKALVQAKFKLNDVFDISYRTYYQHIYNYIYLNPENEFVLTIRGAFPLYQYRQTTAGLFGNQLQLNYKPVKQFAINATYSLLRGYDLSQKIPLINMAPDDIALNLKYSFQGEKKFLSPSISVLSSYHFKQNHLLAYQDYMAAPDAYFLLGLAYSQKVDLKKGSLNLALDIENLLNQKYRDYLNRLRYFADETGINFRLRVMYNF